MANPEAIERGKRVYEECVRARCSSATFEWQQVSTQANGPVDALRVNPAIDGRVTEVPPVSFELLESTDAEIRKFVDGMMDSLMGTT